MATQPYSDSAELCRANRHALHCLVDSPISQDGCWAAGLLVVMNEVVIDRGISPFLTNLEAYCDGIFVTHVQA
eukprot:scaffold156326_cov22-Tisochrysis_lutea.AAC.1